ncbi:MAG: hypothetical protein WCW68_12615 [Methanothrix sp.]
MKLFRRNVDGNIGGLFEGAIAMKQICTYGSFRDGVVPELIPVASCRIGHRCGSHARTPVRTPVQAHAGVAGRECGERAGADAGGAEARAGAGGGGERVDSGMWARFVMVAIAGTRSIKSSLCSRVR